MYVVGNFKEDFMKKSLFMGMTVLLAASLIFMACPPEGDEGDITAPTLSGAPTISANHREVTLTFSENIVKVSTDAALKAAVTFAADGTNFILLVDGDTVEISGATLIVTFSSALTTATNKITVAAKALKDASGNETEEIETGAIDASAKAKDQLITLKAIEGVTAPVTGVGPVATITPTTQYTGTVTWAKTDDDVPLTGTFAPETAYTATITLTPESGYTLMGITDDFFTVAGATAEVTNVSASATIVAKFLATGETDTRKELTAGSPVSATATDTSKAVTFTGATGLTLSASDFAVTGDKSITDVSVTADTVTVTAAIGANTDTTAKTYIVSIASTSQKIKGAGQTVTITQAAATSITVSAPTYQFDGDNAFTGVDVPFTATGGSNITATVSGSDYKDDYEAEIVDSKVEVRKATSPSATTTSGTELTVTVMNDGESDSTTFIVLDKQFTRTSAAVEYTVQKVDAKIAQLTPASGSATWYYVEDQNVLTAVSAIYEPNSPTVIKNLNGTVGKTSEWTPEISADVLAAFVYSVAVTSADDVITLVGTAPTASTNTKLVVIDLGYSDKMNTSVPKFYMNNSFTGGANTRLAVNAGTYMEFDKTDSLGAFAGNLLIRNGGKARENGTSGWGLGQNAQISIVWGGNFAVFPGNKDGSAISGQTSLVTNDGKMFDNWLIGTNGFLTWDGSDAEASGTYIDIIQNNLHLHGAVTLERSLGTPYNIFLDQGSRFTIDVIEEGISGGQQGWPKGLWNNSTQLSPYTFVARSIKGVASSGNMPTIGDTTETAATIVIKSDSNLLHGFIDTSTVTNASTVTANDTDVVLYAASDGTYRSGTNSDVTSNFTPPTGIYIDTWKIYTE
jgi:hypothetical protein